MRPVDAPRTHSQSHTLVSVRGLDNGLCGFDDGLCVISSAVESAAPDGPDDGQTFALRFMAMCGYSCMTGHSLITDELSVMVCQRRVAIVLAGRMSAYQKDGCDLLSSTALAPLIM
jgi:hypothetical protein